MKTSHYSFPNRTLIVGIPPIPPYIYDCAVKVGYTQYRNPRTCEYPGIDFEIFEYIVKYLNISVRYHAIPIVDNWGTKPNNGLLKELSEGVFDTMNTWYRITEERIKYFDYTMNIPYEANKIGFIVSKSGESISLEAGQLLYKVFPLTIWIATSSVILVLGFLLHLSQRVAKRKTSGLPSRRKTVSAAWITFTIVMDEFTDKISTGTISGNLVMVVQGFAILFVLTLYQGGLVSSLMRSIDKVPFKSMTELAALVERGQYKLMHDCGIGNAFFWGLIRESTFSAYRALNKSMTPKTTIRICNVTKILDMMEQDPTLVYPGQDLLSGGLGLLKGRCKLKFIQDDDSSSASMTGFIFRRKDPFMPSISVIVAGLSSMIHRTEHKYIKYETVKNQKMCPINIMKEGDPLALQHYFGIIGVCAAVLLIAGVALIMEIGFQLLKKHLTSRRINTGKRHSEPNIQGDNGPKKVELKLVKVNPVNDVDAFKYKLYHPSNICPD